MKIPSLIALALAAAPALAFDAKGVKLGDREADVRRAFPSAHCRPLEWQSRAADRRCDDAKVSLANTTVRATFYIKNDAVQAFDLRFHSRDAEEVAKLLKSRWGAPLSETKEAQHDKPGRSVYKVLWEAGRDRALLVSQEQSRRASVLASRGNFDEEIYRISPEALTSAEFGVRVVIFVTGARPSNDWPRCILLHKLRP